MRHGIFAVVELFRCPRDFVPVARSAVVVGVGLDPLDGQKLLHVTSPKVGLVYAAISTRVDVDSQQSSVVMVNPGLCRDRRYPCRNRHPGGMFLLSGPQNFLEIRDQRSERDQREIRERDQRSELSVCDIPPTAPRLPARNWLRPKLQTPRGFPGRRASLAPAEK